MRYRHTGNGQQACPERRQQAAFPAVVKAGVDHGEQVEDHRDVMDGGDGVIYGESFRRIVDDGDRQDHRLDDPEAGFIPAAADAGQHC